mgnify:CR=1
MRVAIIVARAVDCCVGVALASGRAALWVALERRAQWVVLVGILAWPGVERERSIPRGVQSKE